MVHTIPSCALHIILQVIFIFDRSFLCIHENWKSGQGRHDANNVFYPPHYIYIKKKNLNHTSVIKRRIHKYIYILHIYLSDKNP